MTQQTAPKPQARPTPSFIPQHQQPGRYDLPQQMKMQQQRGAIMSKP